MVPPIIVEDDFIFFGRFLQAGSKLQLSTAATIAWYCFLLSIVIPLVACLVFCWYQKLQSHRRALMALQREHQLEEMSRIEANIQTFSEAEKTKRVRMVRTAIKCQIKKITKTDLKKRKVKKRAEGVGDEDDVDDDINSNDSDDTGTTNSCSICLEDLKVGESVVQSYNSVCHHLFHEDCIISWLTARQDAFCPYCRRPFLCMPLKTGQTSIATSIASQDHFSSTLDDLESTRVESSVIAPIDEQDLTEESEGLDENEDLPSDKQQQQQDSTSF